ncbi:phosphatase PAP2 family protein [Streptomyces rishiriensis]|uniref:Membrane-associated phospholipid phosphatase n=1 Tax=Streptomyces rishiriensis TaxID=68264 RepID=A0ABU0NHB1_STRRH|nr:phosphatase PAP2 family protein [Streptomyces rishiriensis]MDQ0578512.1 membrane-associated phospholipid phosphatase [Streptomyces rishiriensis]
MKRGDVAELAGSCGLGAWAAFGVLTMTVVGHDGTPLFADAGLLSWSTDHRPDVAVAFARGLTATGTGVIPFALAALAGIIAGHALRQRALAVALCLICLGSGQALRYAVMTLVARPRPPRTDWATHASGWAFPSGHTTTSALTAGLLVIAVCVRGPRGRAPLVLIIGGWGALVGLTRIYLGVHWFTDIVGGWLFALGWLGTCLCAVSWWLPERLTPGTTNTDVAREQREDHASDDPGRRGRSRPA